MLQVIRQPLSRAAPEAGCAEVRAHAEVKIKAIDEKTRALTAMKHALSILVAACVGEGPLTHGPMFESLETTEVVP